MSNDPDDGDVGEGFEQYLEAIYQLDEVGREASTSALAEWLDVRMASVTGMLKRLQAAGLIHYESHQPAQLTQTSIGIALRIVRRHRLWEVFLCEKLGVPWYCVFPHACELEHATSHDVELALERYLGFPKVCPHGFFIPDQDGHVDEQPSQPLISLEAGQRGRVARVSERQVDLLEYLASKGMAPGVIVTLIERSPFDGPITVDVDGAEPLALSAQMAGLILIEPLAEDD